MDFLPATRTTALSAGSSTESWLFRLRLSCLDRFQGRVSPFGPDVLWGHGDRDPPERSLRNERSLTHERSLRLSSSEEDMLPGWKKAWGQRRLELQYGVRNKHAQSCSHCQLITEYQLHISYTQSNRDVDALAEIRWSPVTHEVMMEGKNQEIDHPH